MAKKGKKRVGGDVDAVVVADSSDAVLINGHGHDAGPSSTPEKKGQQARHRTAAVSSSNESVTKQTDNHDDDDDNEDQESGETIEVQVNRWSLHELKTACDDALKQYYGRPSLFVPSHVHTDVRLLLGWTASLIAIAASAYAYKVPFQSSRPWVLAGVVSFAVLSGLMAAYARWIERDTVFVGQRKVFAGRIETQKLEIRSSCEPYKPVYNLALSYVHSSNGGRSLIRKSEKAANVPFNEVFDEEGRLVRRELERRLKAVLDEVTGGV